MRTVFSQSGVEIEITGGESIRYRAADGCDSNTPDSHGSVGFAVHVLPMCPSDNQSPYETKALFFMRPSEARALGSAILSAAAETSAHRIR